MSDISWPTATVSHAARTRPVKRSLALAYAALGRVA